MFYLPVHKMWEKLLEIPGNNNCSDCGCPDPRSSSINLGITLCVECAEVHKSLGVQYSKTRSLTLDDWEPEMIKVMIELGNSLVNKIYEANVPVEFPRARKNCTSEVREAWIRAKYVDKLFVKNLPEFSDSPSQNRKWSVSKIRRRPKSNKLRSKNRNESPVQDTSESEISEETCSEGNNVLLFGNKFDKISIDVMKLIDQDSTDGEEEKAVGEEDFSKLNPNLLLYKAAAAHNIPVMCEAFVLGADKDWINPEDRNRSPIHAAVLSDSVMPCTYLLINDAKPNVQDQNGKTPLHLATEKSHLQQVCLFLKNGADQHLIDDERLVPLAIAERKKRVDIITLLRMARLNETMKDSGSCDILSEVVGDFSKVACIERENIQRRRPDH